MEEGENYKKQMKNIPLDIQLQVCKEAMDIQQDYIEELEKQLALCVVSQRSELLADEKCNDLIHELDNYARNYDNYDYGLPTGIDDDNTELKEMRLLVNNWFKANCS